MTVFYELGKLRGRITFQNGLHQSTEFFDEEERFNFEFITSATTRNASYFCRLALNYVT
jgi:hypothetical protein